MLYETRIKGRLAPVFIFALTLALAMPSCSATVIRHGFSDDLKKDGWTVNAPDRVSVENGALKITSNGQFVILSRNLDIRKIAGKTCLVYAHVKGERIHRGANESASARLQVIHRKRPHGYPQLKTEYFSGTFNWRPVEMFVEFPPDTAVAELVLAMQFTSGTVWFRDIEISVVKPDDSFPYAIPQWLRDVPYKVEIDTESAMPHNRLLYGLNSEFANSSVKYGSKIIDRLVGELKPGMLRFPGGTLSNWYNWRDGVFESIHPGAPSWAQLAWKYLREGRRYDYHEFMALVKRHGIEPIIVLNILEGTPEDAVDWLRTMRDEGLRVRYCELGNETYFRTQANHRTATINGYVEVTKRFAKAIREFDPEIRIGVCAGPFDGRFDHWNRELAKYDYYDAVIFHEYSGPVNDIFRRATVENLLGGENAVSDLVAKFRKTFGDRQMWLTEWNLRNKRNEPFRHSGASVIYLASRYLGMLEHPEIFEIALAHHLCGGFFGAFRIDYQGAVTKHTDFAVWRLIAIATDGADKVLRTTVSPSRRPQWEFAMSNGKAFKGENGIKIFFINKLPMAKDVEITVDGRRWTEGGKLSSFSVLSLSRKRDVHFFTSGIRESAFKNRCTVPAYSINVIELTPQNNINNI